MARLKAGEYFKLNRVLHSAWFPTVVKDKGSVAVGNAERARVDQAVDVDDDGGLPSVPLVGDGYCVL